MDIKLIKTITGTWFGCFCQTVYTGIKTNIYTSYHFDAG